MISGEYGGKDWRILPASSSGKTPYYFEQLGPDYGDKSVTRVLPAVRRESDMQTFPQHVVRDNSGRLFAIPDPSVVKLGLEDFVPVFDPNARGTFPDESPQPFYSPLSSVTVELPRISPSETRVFPTYELLWALGGVKNRLRAVREYISMQAVLWKDDAKVLFGDVKASAQALIGIFRDRADGFGDMTESALWGEGFDMPEWNGPITETIPVRRPILGPQNESIYFRLPE